MVFSMKRRPLLTREIKSESRQLGGIREELLVLVLTVVVETC